MEHLLEVILTSVWDVRIGIAVALFYGFTPFWALFLSILCGLGTVIPSFGLLKGLLQWDRFETSRLHAWLSRITCRHHHFIDKYAYLGVFLMVALPLPGTGPWMGMLTAALLKMQFVRASMSLALGIVLTACVTLAIAEGILSLIPLLG